MKTALVIGGCGFIGSNIVNELIKSNEYKIKVFDNLSTGSMTNLVGFEIELIEGDILNKTPIIAAARGVDVIFHLAANIGNLKSLNDPVYDSTVNVIGTLNVLEAARINNVKKVIYSSSAAIYGELLYQPIDEAHPLEPESPYGVSKLAGEKHCLWFGKHYSIEVVCLRYFNVYGINQYYDEYGNVIPKWVNLILNNNPIICFGDGSQTRDFVNVIDIAKANIAAAEKKGLHGFFNISSGESITINLLANMIQEIFNKDIEIIYKPFRAGEVKHCKANIKKAHSNFQFQPTINLKEGLKEYIEWVRSINS